MSHLPQKCKKIIIPYVYSTWQWSTICDVQRDLTLNFNKINADGTNIKYINKEVIQSLKKFYKLQQILELYDEGKIDFKYKERMENEISILRKNENSAQVKVSDFIIENYKKQQLFTTQNHPTYPIFKHMVFQIAELLNLTPPSNKKLDDSFLLPGNLKFSSYDINYHNFEFPVEIDDNLIKKYITDIYNLF